MILHTHCPLLLLLLLTFPKPACLKEGWTVEVGEGGGGEGKGEGGEGGKMVAPKAKPSKETVPEMRPDLLQKMARHISFLERQNQA